MTILWSCRVAPAAFIFRRKENEMYDSYVLFMPRIRAIFVFVLVKEPKGKITKNLLDLRLLPH